MMGLFIGRKGVDISQAQWSEALNNPFGRSFATNCQSNFDGNKSQMARVLLSQSGKTITIIWIKLRLDWKGQASSW